MRGNDKTIGVARSSKHGDLRRASTLGKRLQYEQLERRVMLMADPVANPDSLITNEDTELTTSPGGNYSSVVSADNPFSYWRLGENSGTTATNEIAGEVDGSYDGSPTLGVPGLIALDNDTAVAFDGTNERVDIPDDADINTGGPYTTKSFELWFRADNVQDRQVLYEQGGNARGAALYVDSGEVYVGAWNTSNDPGPSAPWDSAEAINNGLYVGTGIEANQTYHLVMVMDGDASGTTGTITGYLNGSAFGVVSGVGQLFGANADIAIGGYKNNTRFHSGNGATTGNGGFFDGTIDEVALYNTALTAGQVSDHWQEAYSVLNNDTDADGDALTVSAFQNTSDLGATVTVNPNGSFTYDPTASPALQALDDGQSLVDTFTYTATDGSGFDTATVSVLVAGISGDPSNFAPNLDLDGNNSSGATGNNFRATFAEGAGPVNVVDTDAILTDADDSNLESLTVTVANLANGADESLAANTTGTNIAANYDSGTGVLSLTGTDSVASYLQVLLTVQYDNTAAPPAAADRLINFIASDGISNSATATTTLSISLTNPIIAAVDDRAGTNNERIINVAATGDIASAVLSTLR